MHDTYLRDICNHIKNGCTEDGENDVEIEEKKKKRKVKKKYFIWN